MGDYLRSENKGAGHGSAVAPAAYLSSISHRKFEIISPLRIVSLTTPV